MARFFAKPVLCGAMLAGLAACAPTLYSGGPSPGVRPPQAYPGQGPAIVANERFLQCVPYARAMSGVWLNGDANTWWAQAEGRYARSNRPEIGAVLVLKGYNDPDRGHLAVVTAIVSEREILVDQANWLNEGEISVRVPVFDLSTGNDWGQVRVWHIPTNALAVRVYEAQGFIHPGHVA